MRHTVIRSGTLLFTGLAIAALAAACSSADDGGRSTAEAMSPYAQPLGNIARGREIWLKSTFGGEKFFSLILPGAPFNLPLGLGAVLTTPRAHRFDTWGVVNDPDCSDGDATTGGLDRCADPNATGIVGIRKFPDPTGQNPFIVGVACAGCHAGLSAQNPPANPNYPTWDNIHLTTGNQYIQVGKIFGANLSPKQTKRRPPSRGRKRS